MYVYMCVCMYMYIYMKKTETLLNDPVTNGHKPNK